MQGSAPRTNAASASPGSSAPARQRQRSGAHLWVPRGLGDAGVLLALALDRESGHPDNCTDTGRQLGVHRDTVRRHRGELLRRGLVVVRSGFLVGTDAGRDLLRQGCDPLPRALIRGRGDRPSLALLRSCAVVYSDAVGWRAERHGCRHDAERAALAGVHRQTIVAARAMLVARGLITVEELRRGRADLRRARLTDDRSATHGRPMGDGRAERLADLARRGRARLRRGAEPIDSEGAEPVDTPLQGPSVRFPLQAPEAPRRIASPSEGCPEAQKPEPAAVAIPVADPQQRRRRAPASAGDVLRELVPGLPASRADRAERADVGNGRAVEALRRIAADPQAVQRLLRLSAPRAVAQLLDAVGVLDLAPRRRDGLAVQVSRALAPLQVLTLALDVALGRPESIAGTLRARLARAVAGETDLVTRCRSAWPIGQFLAAVAGARVHGCAPSSTVPTCVVERHALSAPPPTTKASTKSCAAAPGVGTASFDELLRGIGLGELVARRTTA